MLELNKNYLVTGAFFILFFLFHFFLISVTLSIRNHNVTEDDACWHTFVAGLVGNLPCMFLQKSEFTLAQVLGSY